MGWKYQPTRLHFFLAALLWALIISSFSSSYFSASKTAPFVERLLISTLPSLSSSAIHFLHVIIRKLAHFTEFGIFATLTFGIFAAKQNTWKFTWLIYSLALVISLALLDEYHQAFVKNRNASLGDSLTDTLGGITFLFFIWLIKRGKFNIFV